MFSVGNDIAVDLLLRLGCDPNIQDHDGNTPVHFACIHGHGAIVAVLTGEKFHLTHWSVHAERKQRRNFVIFSAETQGIKGSTSLYVLHSLSVNRPSCVMEATRAHLKVVSNF